MPRFQGKRTDRFRIRLQLGIDPEMGTVIRTTRNGLTYEMRIIELIEKGLDYEALFGRNGDARISLHTEAHSSTRPPMGAQPRTHLEEKKERIA